MAQSMGYDLNNYTFAQVDSMKVSCIAVDITGHLSESEIYESCQPASHWLAANLTDLVLSKINFRSRLSVKRIFKKEYCHIQTDVSIVAIILLSKMWMFRNYSENLKGFRSLQVRGCTMDDLKWKIEL